MSRVRFASLAVAAGLVFCSGCFPVLTSWWHRRHGDCECMTGNTSPYDGTGLEGPMVGPPDGTIPLGPPPGAPFGGAPIGTPPHQIGPPPRVVPIPQANPMPYTPGTPTRFLRRFAN